MGFRRIFYQAFCCIFVGFPWLFDGYFLGFFVLFYSFSQVFDWNNYSMGLALFVCSRVFGFIFVGLPEFLDGYFTRFPVEFPGFLLVFFMFVRISVGIFSR